MSTHDIGLYKWVMREKEANRILPEVDGYYVWYPETGGCVDEHALLYMLEYLKSLNAAWDWQIQHDPVISGS